MYVNFYYMGGGGGGAPFSPEGGGGGGGGPWPPPAPPPGDADAQSSTISFRIEGYQFHRPQTRNHQLNSPRAFQ